MEDVELQRSRDDAVAALHRERDELEQRFGTLLTATNDVVYRMSPDWSVMHQLHGRGFLANTETSNPDWLQQYIPESDREIVRAAIAKAIRSKGLFELEHRVFRADGSIGWVHSRAAPVVEEDGDIREWFGFASDITERVNADRRAGRELETTRMLLETSRSLAVVADLPTVLDRVVNVLVNATGRGRAILNLWHPEEAVLVVAASAGRRKVPVGGRFAYGTLAQVTKSIVDEPRIVVVDYDAVTDKRYPLELGIRQALVVPLIERGEFIGFVSLDDPDARHEFDKREREVCEGIAGQAATAILNARLVEAERERTRLGRSMVQISADLASSLDVAETLPRVLDGVCAELASRGAFVADRVAGGWRIRHLAGLERSPFGAGYFAAEEDTPSAGEVLRTKEPYLCQDCSLDPIVSRDLAERGGYEGFVLYPMIVRGEVVGLLAVFFSEPRALSAEEVDYLRRVAFAISLADENSRLYESEHRIAETLQTALLALPEAIPGIEFAHLYHSATETARVGGDFYDLFALEHDRIGITIGDISGHGVDAAVLTSLVKNAIRVRATQQETTPGAAVAGASALLLANSSSDLFATVFFGVLDLQTGDLEYCNAGHTTGACVCCARGMRSLPSNSPLIGAIPDMTFATSTDHIEKGSLLFLYTDGLTEARRDGRLYGEARLFDVLSRQYDVGPADALAHVLDDVLEFAGGHLSDDLAILVVQRLGCEGPPSG